MNSNSYSLQLTVKYDCPTCQWLGWEKMPHVYVIYWYPQFYRFPFIACPQCGLTDSTTLVKQKNGFKIATWHGEGMDDFHVEKWPP